MRSFLIPGIALLFAWSLAGSAAAGMISISGDREYNVSLRDADRVEALTALFAATRGQRMLQLSDGVTGRIAKVQLSDVPFDVALQALLGDEYQFEVGSNGSAALYRITNPKVPAPVVMPPLPVALVDVAQPPMIREDPRYSIVLHYEAYGTGSGYTAASTGNRISLADRNDRRSRGIRYTESVPYVMMNEYFDPYGNIIRQPNVYYDTYGTGLNFDNGVSMYPDWSSSPYLGTDSLDLGQNLDLGGDGAGE